MLKVGNYVIDNPKLESLVDWLENNGEPDIRKTLLGGIKRQLSDGFENVYIGLNNYDEHCIDSLWIPKDCIEEEVPFDPDGWNKLGEVEIPDKYAYDTVLICLSDKPEKGSMSIYKIGCIDADKIYRSDNGETLTSGVYFKLIK